MLDSGMINKIQKAKQYASEPERIHFESLRAAIDGNNGNHQVEFTDGHWRCDCDYFSHTRPEGLSPFDRAERAGVDYSRAENIAYGQADAAAVMRAWLESPGHRANILDCDLTKLGVGVAEGPGGPWWTQLFGS